MAQTKKTEAIEEIATPKEKKYVKVYIPKIPGEQGDKRVIVNGRVYTIRKGMAVDVPEEVAEVIEHSEDMRAKLDAYIEQNRKD